MLPTIGREQTMDEILGCLLTAQHRRVNYFLLGQPGCGKSHAIDDLSHDALCAAWSRFNDSQPPHVFRAAFTLNGDTSYNHLWNHLCIPGVDPRAAIDLEILLRVLHQ